MIQILSGFISITLSLIAILHFLWGFRVWAPLNDELQLARSVAGFTGIEKMPSSQACFFVALYLVLAALLVLISGGVIKRQVPGKLFFEIATSCVALVFLIRGLFAYTGTWARMTPEQPFRTLDACIILRSVCSSE